MKLIKSSLLALLAEKLKPRIISDSSHVSAVTSRKGARPQVPYSCSNVHRATERARDPTAITPYRASSHTFCPHNYPVRPYYLSLFYKRVTVTWRVEVTF